MHYEERFWTKYALKLNSERTAQELACAAQDTAVEEAKSAYAIGPASSSTTTTPLRSPRQAPLKLADLEPLDNTTSLIEGDEPSVTPEVNMPANIGKFRTIPVHDEPADTSAESEQLLERECEELLCSVDKSGHPLCDWKIDDTCTACLFEEYRRACIKALTAREIKRTDIADIMAVIGVLAPTMPTTRMHEFFSARQLKVISEPGPELPDANVDDEKIMKTVRQNLKAGRPDIRAKALERELLWGEATGPIQARNNAKNLWDTFKLARYGKAFIIAGNDSAPLVQIIDNHGSYMRLYLKVRGVMLLEEVGTFVVPTRKEMVPALVATLPTLELLKEHVKEVRNRKANQLKRSWGHQDDKIGKKRLI
ncbi:hypothetical protein BGX21_002992 [Mortierella sp. AD011]|nr:hypothetical protein BGX20_003052 [Mortierella sp. AD010]KAF9378119.1 hypothetical protein BGX21_002992 [Mortierella sp. AD011]